MPRLDGPPNADVVASLKGVLDYYYWRGIPVVRRWPTWTLKRRAPAVVAAEARFTEIRDLTIRSTQQQRDLYRTWSQPYSWTWSDFAVALAFGSVVRFD